MQERSSTVCFSCGQAVGLPPRINHRADGSVCQACADRALGSVPAPLPGVREVVQEEELEEAEAYERVERHRERTPEDDVPPPDMPA